MSRETLNEMDEAGLIISSVCTGLSVLTLMWLFWKIRTRFTPTFILALVLYLIAITAMAARYALPAWSHPRLLIVVLSLSLLELQLFYFVFKLRHLRC